ncbi:hypothetical protein [Allorhizocola rhizosphaerae]|uniref:hypothetical protein n=1 Tax=Allorhizocola rhizosphaerae TaxID=1872709 RepID=UPI000E3CD075|nr:hypothetical protein [Allorhizocola rhizosphaerae]
MSVLADIVLVAATLTAGLEAGVFWLYWHAIMPGLRRTDDRTFVGAFQSIDRARVRRDFQEAKWVRWNGVRVVLSVAAFGCLLAEMSTAG